MARSQTGKSSPFKLFMAMYYIYIMPSILITIYIYIYIISNHDIIMIYIYIYLHMIYIYIYMEISQPQGIPNSSSAPRFPGGSQVCFPNGEVDPWHSLSVLVAGTGGGSLGAYFFFGF